MPTWPCALLHPLLAQRIVRQTPSTLVRAATLTQVLVASRTRGSTAVGPLIDGTMPSRSLLRLNTFATEIFMGTCQVALPVIVEVLLLVAQAIHPLLTVVAALRSINTGFLAGGWIDPLRRKFTWNSHCDCNEQAGKDIFKNSLDTRLQ